MFRKSIRASFLFRKTFLSTTPQNSKHNVAIIGAAGGIGQPLSLLLKLNPNIGELRLHDLKDVPGVAADLSHIETAVSVSHADGKDYCTTLKGADIIVVPAGMPRKPGMKREDLFNTNAQVVFDVAKGMAEHSPEAILIIITNPVNAVVPIACEVLKEAGKLNPRKIFGCSTLDSVRANTFVAGIIGADPKTVNVPVIGGHSGITIIPVLSRSTPPACIEGEQLSKLIKRVQDAGTEVVKAKAGKGSATLSMAYAASRLTFSILRALDGEANIVESAYVLSDVLPEVKYLATQLVLGKCGIEKNLGLGKLSDAEQKMVCDALGPLKKEIAMGEKFAQDQMCGGKKK